jgi:hypothetical protein
MLLWTIMDFSMSTAYVINYDIMVDTQPKFSSLGIFFFVLYAFQVAIFLSQFVRLFYLGTIDLTFFASIFVALPILYAKATVALWLTRRTIDPLTLISLSVSLSTPFLNLKCLLDKNNDKQFLPLVMNLAVASFGYLYLKTYQALAAKLTIGDPCSERIYGCCPSWSALEVGTATNEADVDYPFQVLLCATWSTSLVYYWLLVHGLKGTCTTRRCCDSYLLGLVIFSLFLASILLMIMAVWLPSAYLLGHKWNELLNMSYTSAIGAFGFGIYLSLYVLALAIVLLAACGGVALGVSASALNCSKACCQLFIACMLFDPEDLQRNDQSDLDQVMLS